MLHTVQTCTYRQYIVNLHVLQHAKSKLLSSRGGDCTKLAVFEILSLREVSRAWKGDSVIAILKRDKKGGSRLMKTGHWV